MMGTCDHRLIDDVIASLAAQRRRHVLACLLDSEEEQASFDRLVEYVAEAETRSPPLDHDAVAASLYHRHLPKLADAGLVQYDSGEPITTTDRTDCAERYLEFARAWGAGPGV